LGGMLIALLLAWVLPKTQLKRPDLMVVVWLVLFVVQYFNNMIEAYFFTTVFASFSVFAGGAFACLLATLVFGIASGVLFLPETHDRSLVYGLSSYLRGGSPSSSVWRIVVGSLVYFPIYFFFGGLIGPFVLPFYTEPSIGLVIPPITVIIPLEFFRGFLYVMSLLLIFATLRANRRTVFLAVTLILYVPGALVPLLVEHSLPAGIVPFHLAEILGDSVVYGAVLTYLLGRSQVRSVR